MAKARPADRGHGTWQDFVDPRRIRGRHLAAGEALFRQGEAVVLLHRVVAGRVRLVRYLEDGASVVLHVARAGETVAEASAFSNAYHCDALAEVPSDVSSVSKADFLASLAADAAVGLGFARLLATQVRDLRAKAALRGIRSAPDRVLAWLRMRAHGNPPTASIDRTWTEIAAELGLTREATYRALATLERDKIIIRRGAAVLLGGARA